MKYIVKGIDEINKIMKAIDAIDEEYFGKIDDSDRRKFKNGQLGYYDVEVGFYDDEYTFHPYSDQEKMKAIFNVLNIIRSDFSEMCIELHKRAIDKLEYSIENKLKKDVLQEPQKTRLFGMTCGKTQMMYQSGTAMSFKIRMVIK